MVVMSRHRAERFISCLVKLAAGARQRRRAELARQAPVKVRHELVSAVIPYSTRRVPGSQSWRFPVAPWSAVRRTWRMSGLRRTWEWRSALADAGDPRYRALLGYPRRTSTIYATPATTSPPRPVRTCGNWWSAWATAAPAQRRSTFTPPPNDSVRSRTRLAR